MTAALGDNLREPISLGDTETHGSNTVLYRLTRTWSHGGHIVPLADAPWSEPSGQSWHLRVLARPPMVDTTHQVTLN